MYCMTFNGKKREDKSASFFYLEQHMMCVSVCVWTVDA